MADPEWHQSISKKSRAPRDPNLLLSQQLLGPKVECWHLGALDFSFSFSGLLRWLLSSWLCRLPGPLRQRHAEAPVQQHSDGGAGLENQGSATVTLPRNRLAAGYSLLAKASSGSLGLYRGQRRVLYLFTAWPLEPQQMLLLQLTTSCGAGMWRKTP